MPSFIAPCSFILPPLLHSFFDHRLTESVQKVFQLSRDKYSVKPPNCYFIQAFRPTHQWKPRQSRMILSYLDFCLFRKQWTQMLPLLVWLSSFIPCRYLEALYSSLKITPASFYVRSTVGSSTTWNRNLILADRLVCRPYRNYRLQLYNLRTADKWHRKITAMRTGQFLSQNTHAKTWWCALQRYRSFVYAS